MIQAAPKRGQEVPMLSVRNPSSEESFCARAEEMGRWCLAADGALPRVGSDDPHERRLGVWRQKQLRGLRDKTLLAEQERYLDTVAPGWRSRLTGVEVFRAEADELGRWLSRSGGTVPSRHSDDPRERQLGGWRQRRLRAQRDGTLPPEEERYLDEVAPGWRRKIRNVVEFHARAQALGQWFVSSDGRMPDNRSDDRYERQLCEWRRVWRNQLRDGTLPTEHEQYLDQAAPGWRPRVVSGVGDFHSQAEALGAWLSSNAGQVPRRGSTDEYERKLAAWRKGRLVSLRAGTLPPKHEACLDEVAPGWRPSEGRSEAFRAWAAELGRWMCSAGRLPDACSTDTSERRLAAWRQNRLAQLRAGTLPPERERHLDEAAPHWRTGGDGRYRAQADELSRWMLSSGRLPSRSSADLHERRLYAWMKSQVTLLNAGTLTPQREECLDTVAAGWRPPDGFETFRARADELGGWLRSTGRSPSARSTDVHERGLCAWRSWQVTLLRAGTLTPQREEYLDTVAAGWRPAKEPEAFQAFQARADELGRWMRSNGAPSIGSTDADERRLARWRYSQSARRLTPQREEYLDTVAPGWRPAQAGAETFRSRAEALGRWMSSHGGAAPSSSSDDADELRLSAWRYGQFRQARTGQMPSERERYLDEVAPGWRVPTRNVVGFHAQARALGRWMIWADRKVPDQRSDDWYERRLNRWRREWLAQLRTGTLPSERERHLDEVAPGWRPRARSGVDEFPDQAVALGRWLASADGGLPSRGSDDLHELRLYRWRQGWLFHLRNGTLPSERERHLDEVAPGWRPRRGTRGRSAADAPAPADDLPGFVAPARPTEADWPDRERGSTNTREGTER